MRRIACGTVVTSLVASLVATGCPSKDVLPPPAAPGQVMVPLPPPEDGSATVTAPEPNHGQVTFDADEPSAVEVVTGTNDVTGTTYKTVCTETPCVTSLRFGDHDVRFTAVEEPEHNGVGTVRIGPQPVDYKFALGHNFTPQNVGFGAGLLAVGTIGFVGGVLLGAFTTNGSGLGGISSFGWAGFGIAALGAVGFGLGLHMILETAFGGTAQAGTGVQWTPPPVAPQTGPVYPTGPAQGPAAPPLPPATLDHAPAPVPPQPENLPPPGQ